MKKFRRRGRQIGTHLSAYEVSLLASLTSQLIELVAEDAPELTEPAPPADPFEEWARELAAPPEGTAPPEDPVLRRLFPDAYTDDPAASADFRRFTSRELRGKKVAEAQVVLAGLARTEDGAHDLQIAADEIDAWLRTLTSLRLAVATRLGITDAEAAEELSQLDEDDPRAFMASVYDWLGFAEETLLSAL